MFMLFEMEDTIIRAEYRAEMKLNEKSMKYEQGELRWYVTLVDTFDAKRHELVLDNNQFASMMILAHGGAEEPDLINEGAVQKLYATCEAFLKDCPVRPIP